MKEFYTVDELANLLDLHSRTIRRYIKEGKLQAKKIGKQWRIPANEVEGLFSENGNQGAGETHMDIIQYLRRAMDNESPYQTYSILECKLGIEEAVQLSELFIKFMNEKDPSDGEAAFQYFYDAKKHTSRYILWGNPLFVGKLLTAAGKLLKKNQNKEK